MPKILVVAAWEPELARFRRRIEELSGPHGAVGHEIELGTLGVGLVESSIAMTQHVIRRRPVAALLLGTCGSFHESGGGTLRAVVTATCARLVDVSSATGLAQFPGPMPVEATFDPVMRDVLIAAGAAAASVANTLAMTTNDGLARNLRVRGTQADDLAMEHLEAFAFARVSQTFGVRCAAVLGIANRVGTSGRHEWRANHVEASANAADVAIASLPAMLAALG